MPKATIPAILDKITTLKDGGVKLIFDTQEVTPDQGAEIMKLRNQFGTLVFTDGDVEQEIEVFPVPNSDKKSMSQRLRAALFREWESITPNPYNEFEEYYRARMERFIESVLEKLPEQFKED